MKEVLQYYHILYGVRTGMSRLMLGYSADSFEGNANSSQHPVCKLPTLWSSNRVSSACAWQTSQVQVHLLPCFFCYGQKLWTHEAWDRVQKHSRLGWFVMLKPWEVVALKKPVSSSLWDGDFPWGFPPLMTCSLFTSCWTVSSWFLKQFNSMMCETWPCNLKKNKTLNFYCYQCLLHSTSSPSFQSWGLFWHAETNQCLTLLVGTTLLASASLSLCLPAMLVLQFIVLSQHFQLPWWSWGSNDGTLQWEITTARWARGPWSGLWMGLTFHLLSRALSQQQNHICF